MSAWAPPSADVINQDHVEIGGARFHVCNQLLQGGATADGKAALAVISVSLDDLDAAMFGIFADLVGLVVG